METEAAHQRGSHFYFLYPGWTTFPKSTSAGQGPAPAMQPRKMFERKLPPGPTFLAVFISTLASLPQPSHRLLQSRTGFWFFFFFVLNPSVLFKKLNVSWECWPRRFRLDSFAARKLRSNHPLLSMLLHSKVLLHWWYWRRYVEVKGWSWHSAWIPFEASDLCLGLGKKGKASLPTPNIAAPRGGELPTEWGIPFWKQQMPQFESSCTFLGFLEIRNIPSFFTY